MALLFDSEAAALAAVSAINGNMGLGVAGDVTTTWDRPREDAEGSWVIAKPEERFMPGVADHSEGDPIWQPDPGMGDG
jgi:hypothetical protein